MENESTIKDISALKRDVENLKGWQDKQNGSIQRIEGDLSKLKYWIMGATLGVALNLLGVIATAAFLTMRAGFK